MIKSISVFLILFLSAYSIFAQNEVGYFVTTEGENVKIHSNEKEKIQSYRNYRISGDIGFSGEYFFYYDEDQNFKKLKQKKIEEVRFGERLYRNYPIKKSGGRRLHEVIMENEAYVLTSYYFLVNYFYIFRKSDDKMVESKTKHSKKKKSDYASLEKKLPKYFSDCEETLTVIKNNIKKGDYRILYGSTAYAENKMFAGIANSKCN